MSNCVRDVVSHFWHGNLKQFILSVGLLTALVVCESDVHSVSSNPAPDLPERICTPKDIDCSGCKRFSDLMNKCSNMEFDYPASIGECMHDRMSDYYDCPSECTDSCCHGFWGDECKEECPGGSRSPCNGHGRCSNTLGDCTCYPGFEGTACELCTNVTKYGPDCSLDCKCEDGECNNGIHGDGLCAGDNPCQSSVSPCGNNSQCTHTGAGRHRCACHDGFAGDGTECAPINPCQNNNGGCDNTTDCVFTGPNQHKCRCKNGYEGNNPVKGCTIKDMCSPGLCGPNAVCETREPLKHSCLCNDGYSWNGERCLATVTEAKCAFNKEGERNCTCPGSMKTECCGGSYGPHCDAYSGCGYMNGNCSDHAWCNETSTGVTCQCFLGYDGDGYTCTPRCHTDMRGCQLYRMCTHQGCHGHAICPENGGCHPQAKCIHNYLKISNETFQCECNHGFHGNGTWCQQNSDFCAFNNGGCDLERAVCNFTEPKVTDMAEGDPVCECKSGYVGDGKLCNTDLLDAISRIPNLRSFHDWLLIAENEAQTNITELLVDRRKEMTVFVSLRKVFQSTTIDSFAVVDGKFPLPNYPRTEVEINSTRGNINSRLGDIKQRTLTSLSGQVINVTLNGQGKYLVNGMRIIQANIAALNGILHLYAAPPLNYDHLLFRKPTAEKVSHPAIAGMTAGAVVLVVIIAIVIYKKRSHSYTLQHPIYEDSNVSYLNMKSQEAGLYVSIPDSTQFENPLFK